MGWDLVILHHNWYILVSQAWTAWGGRWNTETWGINNSKILQIYGLGSFQIPVHCSVHRSLLFKSPSKASWLQQKNQPPCFFHHQLEVQNNLRKGMMVYINWSTHNPVIFAHWTFNSLGWYWKRWGCEGWLAQPRDHEIKTRNPQKSSQVGLIGWVSWIFLRSMAIRRSKIQPKSTNG